ncbi:MAG: iron ABC transporter ATP-binding protein [Spirochaetae bacterium HGW-Spirochaetae-2]|jgi:iron complex transport system ATP-binding protein|nr:MAG: iron ABC transporter ATP-binding protein [Spirochaetae bacterium HGW-Spirochaetae-2]
MILRIQGVDFHYKSVSVIKDVSFAVVEGEVFTILGRNGAGKTTLLKCLNHILSPQGGAVWLDGIDTRDMRPVDIARRIGWVPQRGDISRMTVYDLILLGRKPYFRWSPTQDDYRKVEEAIDMLGIGDISLRYVDELSGGEFQLVQIVRALAQDPRVILLDEPTGSLDIRNQYRLMEKLGHIIHNHPRAAVMTMHDINLAIRYSDKFLLLKDGCICSAGDRSIITPENIREVYDMPVSVVEAGGYPLVVPL